MTFLISLSKFKHSYCIYVASTKLPSSRQTPIYLALSLNLSECPLMINVDIGSQSCTELSNKMASLYGLVDECFDKPNSEPWILP